MNTLFETEILYVTKSEYKNGWGFEEHAHSDYYQMICVISGSCSIDIAGDLRRLTEGQTAFIAKDAPHSLYTMQSERAVVVDVKFIVRSGEDELDKYTGFRDTSDDEFLRGMELIASEAVRKKPMFKELIEKRLSEQLIYIVRSEKMKEDSVKGELHSIELDGLAADIAKYVENNYASFITLDDISEELGYSKVYLCQTFKRQTGVSIFDYLYDLRLRQAKKLLKDTNLSHAQIINKTGFKTVNHFNRCFKQVYGISPGKMRRSMKEIMDVPVFLSNEYDSELKKTKRVIVCAEPEKRMTNKRLEVISESAKRNKRK